MSIASTTNVSPQAARENSSRRYLALWFPFLSTDRIRRSTPSAVPADTPFAVYAREQGALRLVGLDPAASGLGLKPGMGLAHARAIVPTLAASEIDPQADAELLFHCAAAAERYTPLLALDGLDGLILDITGCAHLFNGEASLLKIIRHRFLRTGLTCRVAIASTPDAARAFAHFSNEPIIPAGQEAVYGQELPLSALEAPAETATALSRAGFRRLGDLDKRASRALTARFGSMLTERFHRILGREDIRIASLRPAPDCLAERHFAEPMASFDALFAVLEKLGFDICQSLERRGNGGRSFEASFFRVDGVVRRLTIETARPTRDNQSLMRLFRLRFDALDDPVNPGFGFDMLRLSVLRSEPLGLHQGSLDQNTTHTDQSLAELVDRLVARFGRDHVRRFLEQDTHDPVRSSLTLPYAAAASTYSTPELEDPPLRPLTLFRLPQPIETMAEVPDGPPLRFRWRKVLHEIAHAEGPERIAPEWWQDGADAARTRDYYRVEDGAGRRFWLYREGLFDEPAKPRWFLHGLFA